MFKFIKLKHALLAFIILTLTMGLSSCGEKEMTLKQPIVYSFKHKLPDSFDKNYDLSSDEIQPFIDGDILFLGNAIRDAENTYNIGVQFYSEFEGRRIFVEKMVLDTPNLKTEKVINEFVEIDKLGKNSSLYWKRFLPLQNISGDSIPLTADFFMLRIDYRLDDQPTKEMSIRFDNVSFLGPVL